jgi:hypothetical protein
MGCFSKFIAPNTPQPILAPLLMVANKEADIYQLL